MAEKTKDIASKTNNMADALNELEIAKKLQTRPGEMCDDLINEEIDK